MNRDTSYHAEIKDIRGAPYCTGTQASASGPINIRLYIIAVCICGAYFRQVMRHESGGANCPSITDVKRYNAVRLPNTLNKTGFGPLSPLRFSRIKC